MYAVKPTNVYTVCAGTLCPDVTNGDDNGIQQVYLLRGRTWELLNLMDDQIRVNVGDPLFQFLLAFFCFWQVNHHGN